MPDIVEYDFTSVGDRLPTVRAKERLDTPVRVNINVKTPVELSQGTNGLFVMNTSTRKAVRDNLKNLLLTNWGERPCQYYFGANLKELTAELSTETFDSEVGARIRTTVGKYMPFVELVTFSIERVPSLTTAGLGAVRIGVKYSIPKANIIQDGVVITILATG